MSGGKKIFEDDAYVIVPSGFSIVERDPGNAPLSVPVYPIGYVLPLDDERRFLVFFPTMELMKAFGEQILYSVAQHEANAKNAPPPGPSN